MIKAIFLLPILLFISACSLKSENIQNVSETKTVNEQANVSPTPSPTTNTEMYLGQKTDPQEQYKKVCGWVDESDIIIELSFADGVAKDTSYETGFYYSSIESTMRLARSGCNYRTGFKFDEMKNKGAVQVGVRGYNDNNRRQLENEPINVIFDADGNPNVSLPIKVKVLN